MRREQCCRATFHPGGIAAPHRCYKLTFPGREWQPGGTSPDLPARRPNRANRDETRSAATRERPRGIPKHKPRNRAGAPDGGRGLARTVTSAAGTLRSGQRTRIEAACRGREGARAWAGGDLRPRPALGTEAGPRPGPALHLSLPQRLWQERYRNRRLLGTDVGRAGLPVRGIARRAFSAWGSFFLRRRPGTNAGQRIVSAALLRSAVPDVIGPTPGKTSVWSPAGTRATRQGGPAPPHLRTSALPHFRTSALPHFRTHALTHSRTLTHFKAPSPPPPAARWSFSRRQRASACGDGRTARSPRPSTPPPCCA